MRYRRLLALLVLVTVVFAGGCGDESSREPVVISLSADGELTTGSDGLKAIKGDGLLLQETRDGRWELAEHEGEQVIRTITGTDRARHLIFVVTSDEASNLSRGATTTVAIEFYRGPFGECNFRYDGHSEKWATVKTGGSVIQELDVWEFKILDARFAHSLSDWADFSFLIWIGGDQGDAYNDNFLLKSITITIEK